MLDRYSWLVRIALTNNRAIRAPRRICIYPLYLFRHEVYINTSMERLHCIGMTGLWNFLTISNSQNQSVRYAFYYICNPSTEIKMCNFSKRYGKVINIFSFWSKIHQILYLFGLYPNFFAKFLIYNCDEVTH